MNEFDEHEDAKDKADMAANGRRGVWCETAVAAIRAGQSAETAAAFANAILQAFDKAFPEVREMADQEN